MSTQTEYPLPLYKVVVDPHGYPFIRPVEEPLPVGWYHIGPRGTPSECMSFIREIEAESPPTLPSAIAEEQSHLA